MAYSLGEEERICAGLEEEEALKAYYDEERKGTMTRTSQITPQVYLDYFRPFAQKGENILYLVLSSGLSNTYSSACLAAQTLAEEYPQSTIRCVDSLSATCGIGLLAEAAAKNRAAGMSLEENAAWLEAHRLDVCHWFMVEDLQFLKRGGRISPTTATLGTMLEIRPILKIEADGTLTNFMKKRGTKAGLKQLVKLYEASSNKEAGERVYIAHTDNPAAVEYLSQAVKEINPLCQLTDIMLSPVIGSHTGPGMCGIVHFGKER